MEIRIVKNTINKQELRNLAEHTFDNLIKAVVDVELKIMALGGELHADEEALLLEQGSKQENLWGINLYPFQEGEQWIEFDSVINIRPRQNNRSRGVEDPAMREKIIHVVSSLVQ